MVNECQFSSPPRTRPNELGPSGPPKFAQVCFTAGAFPQPSGRRLGVKSGDPRGAFFSLVEEGFLFEQMRA